MNPSIKGSTYESGSRIDFIFVNQHFTDLLVESTTADTESGKLGSDHFSIDVTLDFRTFMGIPIETSTPLDTTSDGTSTSKESDSSLRINFFVLPVIFLVVIRLKKQFKKELI